ncbi:MAG: winged helix-turn-helix transcriptional regulator [Spongiibacteraceae bacterium]
MNNNNLVVNSAIAKGLDVIGDRWCLLILRDAFLGRRRFEEFRRYTGASKATLTRRLSALVTQGVMLKCPVPGAGKRLEYRLSEKGAGLLATSLLAWQWEHEWLADASISLPNDLIHRRCKKAMSPQPVCGHCEQHFSLNEVRLASPTARSLEHITEIKSLSGQRRVRSSLTPESADLRLAGISDLLGDRWTLLILISAFFGARRYDAFAKQLNIASNILSSRLNLLVDNAVLKRRSYQESPPRQEYKLTAKGLSLYPVVMAMRQWAVEWEADPNVVASLLHVTCGEPLNIKVKCGSCAEIVSRHDIEFVSPGDTKA